MGIYSLWKEAIFRSVYKDIIVNISQEQQGLIAPFSGTGHQAAEYTFVAGPSAQQLRLHYSPVSNLFLQENIAEILLDKMSEYEPLELHSGGGLMAVG